MSPRRQRVDRWPWPEDTPIRRREKVAHGYRDELHKADPDRARLLDERLAAWGQTWILGNRRQLPEDDLLTTEQVADHWDVAPRTVDQWHHRDGLRATRTRDGIRYRVADVIVFLQRRQSRRRRRQPRQDTPPDGASGSPRTA